MPLAPELYCSVDMSSNAKNERTIQLLRWVFQRGNQLLTCRLDREGRQAAYSLSLIPHWGVNHAITETFDAGISAFHRHAALADHLRSEGWTLTSYTVAH